MKVIFKKHISKRKPPLNLLKVDYMLFEHEFEKEIKETHLIEVSNAIILKDIIIKKLNFKKL